MLPEDPDPSGSYPHTEMLHGRSLTHMAHLHDVPKLHLKRLVRALDAARFSQEDADSNHARAQFLVKLQYILKPVRPAH
ncbi:hypothetical protein RA2_04349 [Roseovarius sp. A-2]|nr:hypothetical protein RA2_04349 [Roseovarius sp. A-2]